jgi:holo-[acyl-carrier protein] synthase
VIVGIGTDLVEIDRLARIMARWGDRFIRRVFSPGEIAYCGSKRNPAMHFAARFAAKESFLKSIGMGMGQGIRLTDIEVARGSSGAPNLHLHGKALDFLHEHGGATVHLTLTHTAGAAAAIVIVET